MKKILTIVFFFLAANSFAQNKIIKKYFDSVWNYCDKDKAQYYTEFEPEESIYKCKTYYVPSMKIYSTSTFKDTLFNIGVGTVLRYYETGELKDSSIYVKNGFITEVFEYYKNGKLKAKTFIDPVSQVSKSEGFDENGSPQKIFTVIQVPAKFPNGIDGWIEFLQKNLKTNVPIKKKAPVGKYTVFVTFIIDPNGNVSAVQALNDPGYGTKEEALRVLSKSPKWQPATQNGKPVIYRHKQGITFQVIEENK